jgi:hypothetical protein
MNASHGQDERDGQDGQDSQDRQDRQDGMVLRGCASAVTPLAPGPHPRRELTLTLRRGVPWPRRSVAAGAPVLTYCPLDVDVFAACGRSVSFCTRQFRSSATYSSFSDGQAISWIQPNCFTW